MASYLDDHLTQQEVATILGVSRQRIAQIENKALKKVRQAFLLWGLDESSVRDFITEDRTDTAALPRMD